MKRRIFLGMLVGALCLWVALHGVAWSEVSQALSQVQPLPVGIAFLLMFVTQWSRVRRWKQMLAPVAPHVSWRELFLINSVGFLMINVLPFRIGEVTRPLLLKRRHQISFSTGLATIVVERIFDGLFATLMLFIGLITMPSDVGDMPGIGIGIRALAWLSVAIFVPILIFFFLAVWQKERATKWLGLVSRFFPASFQTRLINVAENFVTGLAALPRASSLIWIIWESAVVWGVVVAAYWLVLYAFGLHLPWGAPFTILGVVAAGMTLPNAPLFVGSFQLFVQAALALYGVSKSMGLAYGLVIHALNLTYVGLAGLMCLPFVTVPVKSLLEESQDLSA